MYFFPTGTLSVQDEFPDSPNVYSWQSTRRRRGNLSGHEEISRGTGNADREPETTNTDEESRHWAGTCWNLRTRTGRNDHGRGTLGVDGVGGKPRSPREDTVRRTRDRKSGAGGNRCYGGSPRTRYAAKRRSGVKITRIVPRQTCNRYSVIESQPQSHLRSHPRSRLPLSNPLILLAQAHDHEPSTGQGKGSGVKPGATRRKTVVFLGSLPAGFFLARKGESLPARSPGGTCRRRPAAPGRGRRRSHGRKHRAHRSLGNRADAVSHTAHSHHLHLHQDPNE